MAADARSPRPSLKVAAPCCSGPGCGATAGPAGAPPESPPAAAPGGASAPSLRSGDALRAWAPTAAALLLAAVGGVLRLAAGPTPGGGWLGGPDSPLGWASRAAFALAALVGGARILRAGLPALARLRPDMNALMSVAVLGALAVGEFGEAVAVVVLFSAARALEAASLERARREVSALVAGAPQEARVLRGGAEVRADPATVAVGETVRVPPGERVPLDGVVASGRSALDESPISGESLPRERGPGDAVYAGTVNGEGLLEVTVTAPASDSVLARTARAVETARTRRGLFETAVDRFSRIYTPAVLALAVGLAVVPPALLWGEPAEWIHRALVLLVIACPCALVVSTPVAVVSGLARGAREGLLIKGGRALEALGRVRAVALDKTGTLTRGLPEVTDVFPRPGVVAATLLSRAASAEAGSAHPLADAVLRRARAAGLDPHPHRSARCLPGRGAEANVGGATVRVGSPAWMREVGLGDDATDGEASRLSAAGRTVLVVAEDDRVLGLLGAWDRPRPDAAAAVTALRRLGVRTVEVLSGDGEGPAAAVARAAGADAVWSSLLPEHKASRVLALGRERGEAVMMVGDGVNDAPALASAAVGVAMGARGSAAAIEAADVALLGEGLHPLPRALALGRAAGRVIRQNVALALGLKLGVLALAATGHAGLALAVVADVGATLLVVGNALRLLRLPLGPLPHGTTAVAGVQAAADLS